jgi:predicted DNA-binding protein
MKTVQTGVRLPAEMHERLKQSSDGVSEEIRRRVEASFAIEDKYDKETRALADDVMELAGLIYEQAEKTAWHEHPQVHAALASAVRTYLGEKAPKPETERKKIRGFEPGRAESFGSGLATNLIQGRMLEEKRQREIAELKERLAFLEKEATHARNWRDEERRERSGWMKKGKTKK